VRINPELPGELEHIINKALEKDRKLRYQSASNTRGDLQRLKHDRDSGRKAAPVGAEARALLEELISRSRTTYVPPCAMAAVYRGTGEVGQALEWLEKGVEQRDIIVVSGLKSEPRHILLHGHPRYQALLCKMNLEP
jgi:hypothetical protein